MGKSGVLEHKSGNISETREDRGKVTIEGLQELTNVPSNGTIPDTLRLPLPKIGSSQPPRKTPIAIISGSSNLAGIFALSIQTQTYYKFGEKGAWAYPGAP